MLKSKRYGPFSCLDTGVPANGKTYTTLVFLHGAVWHSGVFSRLVPLVSTGSSDTRLVFIDRRGYPGSEPHSASDLALLDDPFGEGANERFQQFLKKDGEDLLKFLVSFVREQRIPPVDYSSSSGDKTGGLAIVGWSMGAMHLFALLGHLADYDQEDVGMLEAYMRNAITYEPVAEFLGYSVPPEGYHPLRDFSLSPEDMVDAFATYQAGYYDHPFVLAKTDIPKGAEPDEYVSVLEYRKWLESPPPTVTFSADGKDASATMYREGMLPGGIDKATGVGMANGSFGAIAQRAMFYEDPSDNSSRYRLWPNVEMKILWGDRSTWQLPWMVWHLEKDLATLRRKGLPAKRKVETVRVPGANHFIFWDEPEKALSAFLENVH